METNVAWALAIRSSLGQMQVRKGRVQLRLLLRERARSLGRERARLGLDGLDICGLEAVAEAVA